MHQPKFESFQAVADRKWLARLYYYHGFYCANHPLQIIFICGVLIFLCSAPIIRFSPLTAKSPSEWNETIFENVIVSSEEPNWVKEKPVAYIQQIAFAVLVEPINSSLIPYVVQDAFQPVFKIVKDLHEHKYQAMSYEKSIKLTDLCFAIHHRDPFLFSDGGKVLPRKGCLQISPANLWQDVASFHNDMDIMAKIYGTPSKNTVSLKENIFGVPLRTIGLFPLNVTKDCLVIRYAITSVLHQYNPGFIKGLKNLLHKKYPPIVKPEGDDDIAQIVHIHYEGDNIIEIYHLCFTYVLVFIYVAFSVSKIEMVKSKVGLAISAVVTVVASLSMAEGLCIFFGMVPSVSSSEIFPYLVIIIGLENILVITRSIVSTPAYLPVPLRVAEGLSREGGSITLNLTTELLLLLIGYLTFVPAVQEFCMVGGVGVLTDFFLQIVFFSTVLSIDLSRLEPQVQYQSSPQVEIDVDFPLSLSSQPGQHEAKETGEKTGTEQLNTWKDFALSAPSKFFSIRQDLPKRLNFAYFWARTRIVQRGCMLFAILYLVYVSSSTLLIKSDGPLLNTGENMTDIRLNNTSNSNMTTSKNILPKTLKSEFHNGKSSLENLDSKCKDNMKSEALWRNLSRQHWPELLDLYGVNVMDRHISVLPPINVQFKVNTLHFIKSVYSVSESVSEFYQDYSKDSRWTASSYAVKFELVDFVKVLYIFTGIFITVAMYLIYVLLTALPQKRRRKHKANKTTIVPATYPVFLDGHEQALRLSAGVACKHLRHIQKIECIDCSSNVIASSCLQGSLRIWDSQTSECISAIDRKRCSSQIWSVKCWDNFVAVGCSNGDIEIWNFLSEHMVFLYESNFCGVTSVLVIPESDILIISRLNGLLEFLELGNRLLQPKIESSTVSKHHHVPLSVKKKVHSNLPSWQVITNSVLHDVYPCYSCRAHRKTISVLATSKDLLISGSYDNLLKVFRSHSGLCLFTLRGHTSPVTALCVDEPDQGAISGSFDGQLLLWSLISGERCAFSSGHCTSIVTIVSSGDRIISLDISELLCIWDRSSRACLQNIPQLPGGCLDLTLISTNIVVCVGKDTLVMLDLPSTQILRLVELEYKDDHVMMTRVVKSGHNAVVCDYGKRLVLFTFLEFTEKLE